MEETQIIATEDKNNPDYSEILDQLYRTHQLNEEQSFDKINMTEKCVLDRKDHTDEHERWNLTEIV